MENENINKMLASMLKNNRDEFTSSFSAEIKDRISTHIIDKTLDTSKDLLSTSDEG